jgi:site-specific recombinase XerD
LQQRPASPDFLVWHCYATWLISDRVPVNDVARLVGYEQISTALNLYTHGTDERYGRAWASLTFR